MTRRELIQTLTGGAVGIPAVKSVERLTLQPEDILVLKCDGPLTADAAQRLKEVLESKLGGRKALVLSEGMDVQVIRKV